MINEFFKSEIILRFILALGFLVLGYAIYSIINSLLKTRLIRSKNGHVFTQHRIPTLLYFSSKDCIPCQTIQQPVIQQLHNSLSGKLNLVEIDAISNPKLASQWGVLSVPTTFILDSSGRPRHINHGIATREKLLVQLNSLS